MTHKTKDCLERPRQKGAKWTNKNIAPDEKVRQPLGAVGAWCCLDCALAAVAIGLPRQLHREVVYAARAGLALLVASLEMLCLLGRR